MAEKNQLGPLGDDELAVSVSEPRNWKGIIISLLVISSICSLIFLAISLLSPHMNDKIKNERLKLEDVLEPTHQYANANETWISNTELIYLDSEGSLMVYDISSKWKTILASSASLSQIQYEKFSLSKDRKFVLFSHLLRPRNTYSGVYRYKLFSTRNSQIMTLKIKHPFEIGSGGSLNGNGAFVEEFDHVEFGPQGSQMIIAFANNLYYLPSLEGDIIPRHITSNGKENYIYNGIPDLLYEEFIFKSSKAFWWHEDGNRLAYASIDNSKVQRMSIVMYGSPPNLPPIPPPPQTSSPSSNLTTSTNRMSSDVRSLTKTMTVSSSSTNATTTSVLSGLNASASATATTSNINKINHHVHHHTNQMNSNSLNNHLYSNGHNGGGVGHSSSLASSAAAESIYPKIINYPYPKPGQLNPNIHIHIVDLSNVITRNHKQIIPPKELTKIDHYVTSVTWIDSATLSVIWMNRAQNVSIISKCSEEKDWLCEKIIDEQLNSNRGWLDALDEPLFSRDKQFYFARIPVQDGLFGSFAHIAQFTMNSNQRHFLTHGQYVVTKILAHRQEARKVYFIANKPGQPDTRHLYSVTDMEASTPREISCLSCNFHRFCIHNEAIFSPDNQYYILQCKGPGLPRTQLRATQTNKVIEELNMFSKLNEKFQKLAVPLIKYMNVPLLSEHNLVKARVKLLLPPGLDENDVVKYPLVVQLNNEPGTQNVDQINQLKYGDYLSSKKDYVYMYIDIRGSAYQGNKFKHSIFKHLGEYETDDIITVINYIKHKLPYINEDKIALYGKAFGGFLVTNLMTKDDPMFNCGVAVSPVTSWRNYLSTFVERFMGLSFIGGVGSGASVDLMQNIFKIKDKEFLLVHGTADRKVNIQHSMLLMKALTENSIPFRLQLYPDGDHSLLHEQYHLYRTMEEFFAKCFQLDDDRNEDIIELPLTRVIKGGKRIITED